MTIRYTSVHPDDVALRDRMKAIAHERRRFGYRRIHVLLKREGVTVYHKRLFRLNREEKLSVRKRGGRKRAIGTRAPSSSCWCRSSRTNGGPSTLYLTSSQMGAGSSC